ncbi:MAG: NADH-quinone oxidoreductase subunit N [Gemmataceae bacterium]
MENLGRDLIAFLPELILCGSIVLLLLLRMIPALSKLHMGIVAVLLGIVAFGVSLAQWIGGPESPFVPEGASATAPVSLFTGLLVYDQFSIFLKLFLLGFAVLVTWLSLITKIPDREDSADFYVLLLGATLGMMLMASATHLLMVFIAVEMASLPSYAMAGFLKGRRQSSEAALKYVVYGGGSAGIMLYGISILAGTYGTGYIPDVAAGLVRDLPHMADGELSGLGEFSFLMLGVLFVLFGVAFKLAAVPFHFWCPDVFEGASAEVAGFLSVASKGAALALLGRFCFALAGFPAIQETISSDVASYLVPLLAFGAALTATFGNLAAFGQTNLKRLLAYSTIAHAGYMMMGFAALTRDGASAVLFYLVIYLFMNLGAFAIVAFIRNLTGSEELRDFRGLIHRAPVLVISLAICLLSLLGIPPLAGFMAKFQLFRVLYDASLAYQLADKPGLGIWMYVLLFVLGINSVISLFYYMKVLKVMIMDQRLEEVEGRESERLPVRILPAIYSGLMGFSLVVLGLFWNPLAERAQEGILPFERQETQQVQDQQNAPVVAAREGEAR